MPPDTGQSKTEAPTPRRRREAREQGQVAYSRDLTSACLLLGGTCVLWLTAPFLAGLVARSLHRVIAEFEQPQYVDLLALVGDLLTSVGGGTALVLLLLASTALLVDFLQVGPGVASALLAPRPERLSPVRGWQRIVAGLWLRLPLTVIKAVAVGAAVLIVVVLAVQNHAGWWLGPEAVAVAGWQLVLRASAAAGGTLLLLALADFVYQRWKHEQELRMTRQELKEELKREEGDPMIRARIRSLQRELSRRRMLEDVKKATVVVTNPTHIAVALRYQRGTMAAPVVVAKGVDHLAQKIIERARAASVPIVQRPALARELYRHVQVGQEIPVSLYIAVAQVLAFVYKLGRGSRGAA